MCSVPILLLAFNRPDTTCIVFDSIRKAKPERLYIAQDGPRNEQDEKLIQEVRKSFVIDRECDVKYLYREKNLGCLHAVTQGINRFFENENFGIILEDDCVMSSQFPGFCEQMDCFYRGDSRIGAISGSNYIKSSRQSDGSYFFSLHLPLLRGWATWKDKWAYYSNDVMLANNNWGRSIEWYSKGGYRDSNRYTIMLNNNRLTIVPQINMITNIGCIGIHSQRAGSFHNLVIGQCDVSSWKEAPVVISKSYDIKIRLFIMKLYIYTCLESLLKKIGCYKGVHKFFLMFVYYYKKIVG